MRHPNSHDRLSDPLGWFVGKPEAGSYSDSLTIAKLGATQNAHAAFTDFGS